MNTPNDVWRPMMAGLLVALAGCSAPTKLAVAPDVPSPAPVKAQVREIELPADTLFDFGKFNVKGLTQEGRRSLESLTDQLRAAQRVDSVKVIGHTDRIGDEAYNLTLSERRADAVREYLIENGVAPDLIIAEGRGESEPVSSCAAGSGNLVRCLAPDRRVSITVTAVE